MVDDSVIEDWPTKQNSCVFIAAIFPALAATRVPADALAASPAAMASAGTRVAPPHIVLWRPNLNETDVYLKYSKGTC